MQRSKSYRAASETFDRDEVYSPVKAITIAKGASKKNFNETVDVVMRLGVDPRKADQMVRGTVNLPHGTGKTARVLVFANGDKAEAAREAGADFVGGDEMVERVETTTPYPRNRGRAALARRPHSEEVGPCSAARPTAPRRRRSIGTSSTPR